MSSITHCTNPTKDIHLGSKTIAAFFVGFLREVSNKPTTFSYEIVPEENGKSTLMCNGFEFRNLVAHCEEKLQKKYLDLEKRLIAGEKEVFCIISTPDANLTPNSKILVAYLFQRNGDRVDVTCIPVNIKNKVRLEEFLKYFKATEDGILKLSGITPQNFFRKLIGCESGEQLQKKISSEERFWSSIFDEKPWAYTYLMNMLRFYVLIREHFKSFPERFLFSTDRDQRSTLFYKSENKHYTEIASTKSDPAQKPQKLTMHLIHTANRNKNTYLKPLKEKPSDTLFQSQKNKPQRYNIFNDDLETLESSLLLDHNLLTLSREASLDTLLQPLRNRIESSNLILNSNPETLNISDNRGVITKYSLKGFENAHKNHNSTPNLHSKSALNKSVRSQDQTYKLRVKELTERTNLVLGNPLFTTVNPSNKKLYVIFFPNSKYQEPRKIKPNTLDKYSEKSNKNKFFSEGSIVRLEKYKGAHNKPNTNLKTLKLEKGEGTLNRHKNSEISFNFKLPIKKSYGEKRNPVIKSLIPNRTLPLVKFNLNEVLAFKGTYLKQLISDTKIFYGLYDILRKLHRVIFSPSFNGLLSKSYARLKNNRNPLLKLLTLKTRFNTLSLIRDLQIRGTHSIKTFIHKRLMIILKSIRLNQLKFYLRVKLLLNKREGLTKHKRDCKYYNVRESLKSIVKNSTSYIRELLKSRIIIKYSLKIKNKTLSTVKNFWFRNQTTVNQVIKIGLKKIALNLVKKFKYRRKDSTVFNLVFQRTVRNIAVMIWLIIHFLLKPKGKFKLRYYFNIDEGYIKTKILKLKLKILKLLALIKLRDKKYNLRKKIKLSGNYLLKRLLMAKVATFTSRAWFEESKNRLVLKIKKVPGGENPGPLTLYQT